jgi:hypothetical protein
MASIYVSYKSQDEAFVRQVVDLLKARHAVSIDYDMPIGVDWRNHLQERLRKAEVFIVFASRLTEASSLQNAEIGAASFCSAFLDGKLMIPIALDSGPLPRTLEALDVWQRPERDPKTIADGILQAIERQNKRVQVFISHAHKDQDLAERLVDAISSGLEVPAGAIRCTSVPGYRLDLGTMAPEALRRELGSAGCVIAVLSPNSLASEWVLFELGAAWANARAAIPLLVGGLRDNDIPGPFRGAAGGDMRDVLVLDALLDQLERNLGWQQRHDLVSRSKRVDLARYANQKQFSNSGPEAAARTNFAAKLREIGHTQQRILDFIVQGTKTISHVRQSEIESSFSGVPTHVYYRLEQLRLLGFLDRVPNGHINNVPTFAWTLSERYRNELVAPQ